MLKCGEGLVFNLSITMLARVTRLVSPLQFQISAKVHKDSVETEFKQRYEISTIRLI